MSRATNATRPHDVVIFGATGFVGQLVAEYLAEHAPDGVRIALGGRSRQRLVEVRAALPARARDWPLVVADVADPSSLQEMAESTTALASTVGPYLRYGLPVVEACADAGTHYADLTGEVLFVRKAIDAVDARARETGARIVTACGYDSIPSDLGVLLLHERAVADAAGGLLDTTLQAKSKGGLSGGTIDSSRAQLEAVGEDKALRKVIFDAYALSPDRAAEPDLGKERDTRSVFVDSETGEWVGPFIMAGFNTRIVRRSNALRDHAYGRRFRYREVSAYGRGLRGRRQATVFTGLMGLAFAGLANPRTRPIFDRLAPSPGEGPSEQNRRSGWFAMKIRTTTETGRRYLATVSAQGDPGYAATAVMLGESALCLALDGDSLPKAAGVLTPATAMGDALVVRLRARDFTVTVDELPDRP
jgi:short subunit dehydrogenase-like uncharacterized protein